MNNDKETAFLQQIETHKGMLYKVCRLYQDREEDRQDLLQEIVLQLWVSYDSFRGDSKFSSWMYRVALNTAIAYLRRTKGRLEINIPYPELAEEVRPVRDPEQQLAIFHRAVQHLNKVEKAVIFLYMEGHSGKDMATILELSPVNVRVRLTRAKEKLQTIIKTMGYEF
ncbi:RNA polymerase sigma factor [Dinghuibacter silviterrae]|uniref:RNA polymerase sigma-70 factor (ECF subfamily) n=1 Tax=Dinghuibacter silviterrae TaxID=1539049 RepID=A0A4R8DR25_9BACT|nr:sigma-70 family RNA polymerase sigma factor [Dinghuibacter silviterrae]TDX00620.1 RNA polymerase sigma-70 factor (ECF subfamily) [Dinghuibacter silviterrae]